jgi:acetate kinase
VDPAFHLFLQEKTGMQLADITRILNSQSGLLGISGLSNDMRTLAEASRNGHERATLAIEVFCYRLAKAVCGLTAALDALDALVFTGGIGENSNLVRERTISHMKILGVRLDPLANACHGRKTHARITSAESSIPCLVVPTNEELMIARETIRLTT